MTIIHGVDESKSVVPLLVDASGRALVVSSGLVGVAPFVRILSLDNLSLPAGTSVQVIGTVTAGELWQIDQVMIRYDGTVGGITVSIRQNLSGVTYIHVINTVFVNAIWQVYNVNFLSDGGSIWEASLSGITLNDDLRVRIYGRMVQ